MSHSPKPVLSLLAAFFAACVAGGCAPDPEPGVADAGRSDAGTSTCTHAADCDPQHQANRFTWRCSPAGECLHYCRTQKDCPADTACDVTETCVPSTCATDTDCPSEYACLGGRCTGAVPASEIADCAVTPGTVLLASGKPQHLELEAFDRKGKRIITRAPVAWGAADGLVVTPDPLVPTRASITGTGISGEVGAFLGDATCRPATVYAYEAVPPDHLRVVVADALTSTPIGGAEVRVTDASGTQAATTDETGAAEVTVTSSGKRTVSVFASAYAYVTYVDVAANDLVARLTPRPTLERWTRDVTTREFDELPDLKGTVHFALVGAPLPANPADLRLARSIGRVQDTVLDFGSQQPKAKLPEGMALGLGEQMFKPTVAVERIPTTRRVWGIFSNIDFSTFTRLLGPSLLGTDSERTASRWLETLAAVREGTSGVLDDPASRSMAWLKGEFWEVLAWETDLPDRPADLDRAVVFIAAEDGGTLVPLGARAALDTDGNGSFDPVFPNAAGHFVLRAAPPHDGLEGHPVVALVLTMRGPEADEGFDPPGALPVPKLLRSGLRVNLGTPGGVGSTRTMSFGRGFLSSTPTVQLADRTFTYATVDGTGLARIDLGGELADGWSVYVPPTTEDRDVTLPVPPEGYPDFLTEPRPGGAASRIFVQSLVFRADANVDTESVATLGGADPAAIGEATEAWTTTEIR